MIDEKKDSVFKNYDLELHYLTGVCINTEVLVDSVESFDSKYFTSDIIKELYDLIISYHAKENTLLDAEGYKNYCEHDSGKKTLIGNIWVKINQLSNKVTKSSAISAKNTIVKLFIYREAQYLTKNLIRELKLANESKKYNVDNIKNLIEQTEYDVDGHSHVTLSDLNSGYGKFVQDYNDYMRNPDKIRGVPTGISEIDRYMISLRNGEFGVVTGDSGSGKSIMLMNFAMHCWLYYGDVIVVTIEMSEQDYIERMYSYISHIDSNRFRKHLLNKKEFSYLDKVHKKVQEHKNKLHIVDMPSGCNISAIKHNINKVIQKNPDKIKLIVIDYMNIISDKDGEINFAWESQVETASSLKLKIARTFKLPVWSAGQTTADNNNAAFSSHIKDQLDVGIAIIKDKDSEMTGFYPAKFFKTRSFKGSSFVLETNYKIWHSDPGNQRLIKKAMELEGDETTIKFNKS